MDIENSGTPLVDSAGLGTSGYKKATAVGKSGSTVRKGEGTPLLHAQYTAGDMEVFVCFFCVDGMQHNYLVIFRFVGKLVGGMRQNSMFHVSIRLGI